MGPVHGISWDDRKRRTVSALAAATAVMLSAGALATTVHADTRLVSVIVRAQPAETAAADQEITSLGGQSSSTSIAHQRNRGGSPSQRRPELETTAAVAQVTLNAPVQLLGAGWGLPSIPYSPAGDVNSMYNIEQMDGAHAYWNAGYTGQGVGVALIDSGVTPVDGLTTPGKVVNGPTSPSNRRVPSLEYLDTFGHGTHMAGIIAGRDSAVTSVSSSDSTHFLGMAPNAQIVSVKVADALGQTDVSQVLAAIDWVVQHQNDNGMNIRVLNLSYGTDSNQSYVLDPLAYAAEQAWLHGIVVVVAAGNDGNWSNGLDDPAIDPYVIAVGASNTENTMYVRYHRPPPSRARVTARAIQISRPLARTSCPCATRDPLSTTIRIHRHRQQPLLPRERHVAGSRCRLGRGGSPAQPAPEPHARSGQGAPRQPHAPMSGCTSSRAAVS